MSNDETKLVARIFAAIMINGLIWLIFRDSGSLEIHRLITGCAKWSLIVCGIAMFPCALYLYFDREKLKAVRAVTLIDWRMLLFLGIIFTFFFIINLLII